MSSLGKRKARSEEDDSEPHGSTLFVSNLPYTATSTDLQTLFSDIAPVRSGFVVLEPGSGVSKGVGYVSFASKDDAQVVFEKTSEDPVVLDGRKLRVQWAEQKPKEKEQDSSIQKKASKPRPERHHPHTQDPLAIRTVVVSGLPPSLDSKVLWKKIRKYPGAEKVDYPVDEVPTTAHVLFTSSATAQGAVTKLHAHVFKGHLLSVTLKKRLDTLAIPKPTHSSTEFAAPSRASRLIIRNLPFNVSDQDLRAIFLPFGPIHSIHIPSENGRSKGFAFVWMLSKKDAQKAMEGCNGVKVRAGMAEVLVGDKQKRKKVKREEAKQQKIPEDETELTEDSVERVIAVDWALSKEKWEVEKGKMAVDDEDEDMEDVESEDGSVDGSEAEHLGVHDDDSDSEKEDDENASGGDESPIRPQLPPPESGTTLFIRNIPFTATEDELRILFRTYGPLRYARITIDSETGRSRGTGFACFWKKEDADKVIEQSELLRVETKGGDRQPVKNPFTLPSILTPDPSSSLAQNMVLHGRTLDVVHAVTRDEAGKLKEEGEHRREKADKRNLYLLREGVILPNTPAAATLLPIELDKRTNSFNARRALLRSNPSLYVSKTRLSIRQIPIWVTERVLKRLALHAVKAFEKDVKDGKRAGLTSDELAEAVEDDKNSDARDEPDQDKTSHRKKFLGRPTAVKQTKIIRQSGRVDPVTGKARSKGYGFLELQKHADALRVLRWANNNTALIPLLEGWRVEELEDLIKLEKGKAEKDDRRLKRMQEEVAGGGKVKGEGKGRLIVEFSIENVQVVKRRRERLSTTDALNSKPGEKTIPKGKSTTKDEPVAKKRRALQEEVVPKSVTSNSSIGALIGRKRRQKKGKKS